MMRPAIRIEALSKEYFVGRAQPHHATFYDLLSHVLKKPVRRAAGLARRVDGPERFLALNNVSFEVTAGEIIGVIGRNGAGKSTLLKVLSRITAPTQGRVEVRGRLASLLEVGTGFHPELSGRENIFLNGAILGMRRTEIARKFDDIVSFAELDRFVDTPVKRYSSGMYVRLAFSVAAHLDVDVLVVDEVLAVGDAAFQERCLRKMEDVSNGGRTVLFVSHNLGAVSRLCGRGIVLDKGELTFDGALDGAILHYTGSLKLDAGLDDRQLMGTLGEQVKIEKMLVNGSSQAYGQVFLPHQNIDLRIRGRASRPVPSFRLTVAVRKEGHHVFSLHDLKTPRDLPAGGFESCIRIPAFHLSPGQYSLEIGAYSTSGKEWLWATSAGSFTAADKWFPGYDPAGVMGLVNLPIWGSRQDFGDDLPAAAALGDAASGGR